MSLLKFAGIVAASLIVLAACSSDSKPSGSLALERSPQESTVRAVEQGDVIGTFGAEQSLAWYGVPFAQAPIGDFGAGGPGIRGLSGVKGDSAQTSKGDKARQADQLKLF